MSEIGAGGGGAEAGREMALSSFSLSFLASPLAKPIPYSGGVEHSHVSFGVEVSKSK